MLVQARDVSLSPPRSATWRAAPVQKPHPLSVSPTAHVSLRLVLAAGAVVLLGIWWLDTPAGSVKGIATTVTAAGRITGLMGAYLVLVQVLLMARVPWVEFAVGWSRLAAWHRALGVGVVSLLAAHVLLIVEGYALTARRNTVAEGWTVLHTLPDMLKALVGMALFLVVGATSGRRLRARLTYESWYWLHLSAYLAIALTFFHQVSCGVDFVGDDLRHRAMRFLWYAMYGGLAAALLWWRVARPIRGWFVHRLLVDAVVPESDDIVSIHLRGRNTHLLGRAGQFVSVRFLTPGHFLSAHPFSLSALPGVDTLRLTVKEAGDHTGALRHLRRGVPVLADGPFGRFTADQARQPRVLLIAGGSGIGPIRALAEELTSGIEPSGYRGGREVTLLYRVSRSSDLALSHELDELARAGRIVVRYLVGRRGELGFDPLGPHTLRELVPDIAERDAFICGPPGMVATVDRSLRRLAVPRRQRHVEEFEL